MKNFIRFIFWISGWKIKNEVPITVNKCVIAVGPHTSNWDFVIGRMAFVLLSLNGRYLMKKELFFPPLGWILKALGGIPVDRKKRTNLTDTAVKYFEDNESMFLVFSPEGTRSYNPNWKRGFYYVALKAKVPIYLCYLDFKTKTGGFHSLFYPTGDVENDLIHIRNVLKQFKGKYPEKGID